MEIINNVFGWVKEVGPFGFLDILLVAFLIYTFLVWLKRTRVAFVLKGILIVTGLYLLSRQFNLVMVAGLFEKFFAVILIVIVVIFQEEIKYFFEQIALWSFDRKVFGVKTKLLSSSEVEILSRTIQDFAREKIGALIVIRGRDIIARHLDGGLDLNGKLSDPLLKSIFDPHSVGHDGAVVIERGKVTKFACHLPLSKSFEKLRNRGTRHAAALGLAELTDALCLVVSEERGTISVVRNGTLRVIDHPGQLQETLSDFYNEMYPQEQELFLKEFFNKNSREKIYAVAVSTLLWFVLVHGAKLTYKSFAVPVTYAPVPSSWSVREIEPKEIEVVLKGTRADFYFMRRKPAKVFLNLKLMQGLQSMPIYSHDLSVPKNFNLDSFEPREVKVVLEQQ